MALYELSWRLGNGRHPAGLAGAIMVVAVEGANQQWYAREDRRKIGLRECQKMAGAVGLRCVVLHCIALHLMMWSCNAVVLVSGGSNFSDIWVLCSRICPHGD